MPKKKHKKRQRRTCPSCKRFVESSETRFVLAVSGEYGINIKLGWACDRCLNEGKAIRANPQKQNYCWYPHFAYFDSQHLCRTCGNEFVFSKEEKKYWFEELQFWVEAEAVNCRVCRKKKQGLNQENKALSDILRKEEKDISLAELDEVIRIYTKWQKEEKVRYYEALLRRKA